MCNSTDATGHQRVVDHAVIKTVNKDAVQQLAA